MPDFATVYDEHIWHVYGFFAYRIGGRTDAEDLTQITFERALRAWSRYDERRGRPGAWLMSIAHNVLIDHYRRDHSGGQEPLADDPDGDARLPVVDGPEERIGLDPELAAALQRLGQREREILALRFGGDLSGPEIAALLDLSLANVQQILSRTLRRLRADLHARGSGRERAGAGEPDGGGSEQQKAGARVGSHEEPQAPRPRRGVPPGQQRPAQLPPERR
jgi:RNA polymerase sigma factor (sigma-70 family)